MKAHESSRWLRLAKVVCLIFVLMGFFASHASAQSVIYYNDESAWAAAVASIGADVQSLSTTPENLLMANEISVPPGTNAAIGPKLTFLRGSTGLLTDFIFKAVNVDPAVPDRSIVYDDNEQNFPVGQRMISLGDIDGVPGFPASTSLYQNDDFHIEFNQNCDVLAFGITFIGNEYVAGEVLRIYGVYDQLIGTVSSGLPNDNNPGTGYFVGIISDVPILRVEWDEGNDGDDMCVRDFRFGIREPHLENITYHDLETQWVDEVIASGGLINSFETTPENVLLADEVITLPGINAELGPVLTFPGISTGLSIDFELAAMNVDPAIPGRALVYNDDEANFPVGERNISIGDVNGVPEYPASIDLYQDDDFEISVSSSIGDVIALGFYVFGNYLVPEEFFTVYDVNGQEIETVTYRLPNDEDWFVFLGVVSEIPIGKVHFNEGFGSDDIGVRDFVFGILPSSGNILGVISADCPELESGLLGVTVDAYEVGSGVLVGSDTTDVEGSYDFIDLPAGDYNVTIITPMSYEIESPEFTVSVISGESVTADFHLSCSEIVSEAKGAGFWKHQVGVATGGKGKAKIDAATLCEYLDQVEAHFNSNAVNQVIIYESPASGECADKLLAAKDLLNLKGNVGVTARAKQQLMSLLLNVAGGNLSLNAPASLDSATVSQAITYCDLLLDDEDTENDTTAKEIASEINGGNLVEAGLIPLETADIAYSKRMTEIPGFTGVNWISPNPFNPATVISYSLDESAVVSIRIYDVAGRLVKTLLDEYKPSGEYQVMWNGTDNQGHSSSSGMYFMILKSGNKIDNRKLILMR